jgi:hypothetical protein
MTAKPIYLIDLAHDSKLGLSSDTMPLQLGLVAAYALRELGERIRVELFKFLSDFEAAMEREPPFILGVSNYIWNIDLAMKVVEVVKRRYPDVIVVGGGPNYPDEFEDQVDFLRQYPQFDIYIYKDGEVPFAALAGFLLEHPDRVAVQRAKLPSCHALIDGEPQFGATAPRVRDLASLPSPYLTGLMDKFFDNRLVPTMQTNRGCPFTCTFCTEGGSYYNKVFKTSHDRKIAEADYILAHVKHTRTLRVTDSNFGMFEEDQAFCRHLGEMQARTGYPEYIMCSTGKNRKERVLKCNELLNGAMRLTASVQSLDPEVLAATKRDNISLDALMYVSDETSDTDTHAYSELILALPHDSVARHEASIDGLMKIGIGNITQHQLALIHGTELNSRATRTTYAYRSGFRPIQRCVGRYTFLGETFVSAEVEEIAIETSTLSFKDYMDLRRLYLTVGIFYNDRVFGEIHALLRILGLSTFAWIKSIHDDIARLGPGLVALYQGFSDDTAGELWDTPQQLAIDVARDVDRYTVGEIGGNIIYKYRAKSIVECFPELHATAFRYLRAYLAKVGVREDEAVDELERFSRLQKLDLLDTRIETEATFSYNILRLIQDSSYARKGGTLDDLHHPVTLAVAHTDKQKATIERELKFYGADIPGLTMLISRYPVKRFWRRARYLDAAAALWQRERRLEVVGA